MMVLESERLCVRSFRNSDWQDLYEYLSHKEVLKYEPGDVSSKEDCIKLAGERSQGDSFWAVCLRENNKMIGHVYFCQKEPGEFLTWEIGYIFNPAYYGQGYATEACRRILQYGFKQLGAHRIIALCNPENGASWKLLERLDMRREGHLIKPAYFRKTPDGKPIWHDAYQYAILSDEYRLFDK